MVDGTPDPLLLAESLVLSIAVSDGEPEERLSPADALGDALGRATDVGYGGVISGIRQTVGAIEYATLNATGYIFAAELAALEVHEGRLRELGAPDLRAEDAHETLLAELARCRFDGAPETERIAELCAELARFAR